ncbi:BgTH12-03559 [Blumeria graminis f. sp. triticale]|nr:BgTH12-03559 [Blumeria graminis f. sp. triticale]
MTREKR